MLNLPEGLSLVSGTATQFVGNLGVGQERQVTWRVQAIPQSNVTTLSYSVAANASNAATKILSRQIQLSAAISPTLTEVKPLTTPIPGQQFYAQLEGSGFEPNQIQVVAIGPGCEMGCLVYNDVLLNKSNTQFRAPLTLAQGTFEVIVRNGNNGLPSNKVQLTVFGSGCSCDKSSPIPLLKQTDPRWSSKKLGTSTIDTIGSDGCAITSLAMIILSFGITTGADGKEVNPENLNNWLTNHGGYAKQDLLVFSKVQEYTNHKIQKWTKNFTSIEDDINNDIRIILHVNIKGKKVGNHFVVVTQKCDDTFLINDPFLSVCKLSDKPYKGAYYNVLRFKKIEGRPERQLDITAKSPVEMIILDPLGRRSGMDPRTGQEYNEIPNAIYYRNKIESDIFPVDTASILDDEPVKTFYMVGPMEGEYKVIVFGTGDGDYSIDVNATDSQNKDGLHSVSGLAVLGKADTYSVSYSSNTGVTSVVPAPTSYEADLSPRPNGKRNGKVTLSDWVQVGRFVAGLDGLTSDSEFQRADCAPRSTFGDGRITLADWVQAGRYAVGLDPVASAGGAFAPVTSVPVDSTPTIPREVKATTTTQWQRGKISAMQISLDAKGSENGLAFSINFDPKVTSFLDAALDSGIAGATLQVNTTKASSGIIGVVLALPTGQQFPAGVRNLLNLRFIPSGGEGNSNTVISFSDQMMTRELVDTNAAPIGNVTYTNAAVTITGRAVATVSAASFVGGEQAAESIVSAFGSQLAWITLAAPGLPLPISLGSSQVVVRDSLGAERFAPLFFVSPGQVNFQIPKDTAEGVATITITNGVGTTSTGLVIVGKMSPSIFAADSSGTGFAAGSVLLVRSDGSRIENNLARYDAASSKFIAQPIDLGSISDQAYLTLYGTGFKNRSELANVKIKIGGVEVPADYAGAQGYFVGLDQVNVKIPRSLLGRGELSIEMIVDGKVANVVKVVVK